MTLRVPSTQSVGYTYIYIYRDAILGIVVMTLGIYSVFKYLDPQGKLNHTYQGLRSTGLGIYSVFGYLDPQGKLNHTCQG